MSFLQWQPKTLKNDKIEKYAYMACSQWNPDKKRSEQIRLYIGRLHANKKNIIVGKKFAGNENILLTLTKIFGKIKGNALLGLAMHQVATGHALNRAHDWLEQRIIPKDMKNSFTKLEKIIFNIIENSEQEKFETASEINSWIGENGGKYNKYLTINQISKNNFCLKRKPNKIAARTSRMGYSIILTSG